MATNDAPLNGEQEALIVAPQPAPEALGVFRDPEQVLQEARRAAAALMDVIHSKKKPVRFKDGELYLEFEDWLTLARFYSMTPVVKGSKPVEYGETRGWEATAEVLLIPTNQIIGSAEAMCLDDEPNWARKPSFQLRSMAQTRAQSKALASVLRWVVVLGGYAKGTPAEEMGAGERITQQPFKPIEMTKPKLFIRARSMKQLEAQYWVEIKKAREGANAENSFNRQLINEIVKAKDERKKELEGATKNVGAGEWD